MRFLRNSIEKTGNLEKDYRLSGGEGGIRTLETLLTPTRFPIVRLRPAQPPLHAIRFIAFRSAICVALKQRRYITR